MGRPSVMFNFLFMVKVGIGILIGIVIAVGLFFLVRWVARKLFKTWM